MTDEIHCPKWHFWPPKITSFIQHFVLIIVQILLSCWRQTDKHLLISVSNIKTCIEKLHCEGGNNADNDVAVTGIGVFLSKFKKHVFNVFLYLQSKVFNIYGYRCCQIHGGQGAWWAASVNGSEGFYSDGRSSITDSRRWKCGRSHCYSGVCFFSATEFLLFCCCCGDEIKFMY